MSKRQPRTKAYRQSTETPSVMTVEEYVERRCPIGQDYGDLVQQVADARDITPLEAKEYISREGRQKAAREAMA